MSALNQHWFTKSIGDPAFRKSAFRQFCRWRALTIALFCLVFTVAGAVTAALQDWILGLFLLSWIGLPAALYVGVESRLRSLALVEYIERERGEPSNKPLQPTGSAGG